MTRAILFDTDVISYIVKSDTRGEIVRGLDLERLPLASFATRAELSFWTLGRDWSLLRTSKLDRYLEEEYETVWPSPALCPIWARVQQDRRSAGRSIGHNDAWIAACAIGVGASLATNNRRDFVGIEGFDLLDLSGGV